MRSVALLISAVGSIPSDRKVPFAASQLCESRSTRVSSVHVLDLRGMGWAPSVEFFAGATGVDMISLLCVTAQMKRVVGNQ